MSTRATGRLFGLLLCSTLLAIAVPIYWYSIESPSSAAVAEAMPAQSGTLLAWAITSHLHQSATRGESPFWLDSIGAGIPLHNWPAAAVFHPLRVLPLIMPVREAAISTSLVLLLVSALSMLLLTRSLGLKWSASMMGAVVYAFCGTSAASQALLPEGTAYALAPALLWGLRLAARTGSTGGVVAAATALGFMLLGGAWTTTAVMVLVSVAWIAPGLLGQVGLGSRRLVLALAGAIAGGLGVGAIQWLASALWLLDLDAAAALFAMPALNGSLPPTGLRGLRHFISPESSMPPLGYIGVTSLPMLVAGLFGPRHVRGVAWTALILTTVLVGVAWTDTAASLPWLDAQLLLLLAALPTALLAALGANAVYSWSRDRRAISSWAPFCLFASTAILLLLIAPGSARGWLLMVFVLTTLAFVIRKRFLVRLIAAIVLTLVFAELSTHARNLAGHPALRASSGVDSPAVWEALAGRSLGDRVWLESARPTAPSSAILTSVKTLNTSEALQTRRWSAFTKAAAPGTPGWQASLMRAASVRTIADTPDGPWSSALPAPAEGTANEPSGLASPESVGGLELYTNTTAFRRAYWVPSALRVSSEEEAADTLQRNANQLHETVVLELGPHDVLPYDIQAGEAPSAQVDRRTTPTRTRCQLVEETAGRIEILVEAEAPGVLVLTDSYASGWSAEVDGEWSRIFPANVLFRGIPVSAGTHSVVFEYTPWNVYLGGLVSVATLLALIVLGLRELVRPAMRTDMD